MERYENFKGINNLFPRRRSFESNSILFSNNNNLESIKPNTDDLLENNFFSLNINQRQIYKIENKIQENPHRQNIHRTFLRLSMINNKKIYLKKAIGYSISQADFNPKPFNETLIHLFRRLHLLYFIKMIVFRPKALIDFFISIFVILKMRILK